MKRIGVVEGYIPNKEPNEDEFTAGGSVLEGGFHRSFVAGAIEDQCREFRRLIKHGLGGFVQSGRTEVRGGEGAAGRGEIKCFVAEAAEAEEFHHGAADRAGADDEGALPGSRGRPVDRMTTNAERLNEGKFFEC